MSLRWRLHHLNRGILERSVDSYRLLEDVTYIAMGRTDDF